MSQPIRGQDGNLVFPIGRKKKLGRGRRDLASCQVSLNSVQRFQGRIRKYLSLSEAGAAILFLSTSPLNRLNRIQQNLTGRKIITSYTKFVFSGGLEKQDGRPGL